MFWVIATIILGIIGIGALLWGFGTPVSSEKATAFIVSGLCVIVWGVLSLFLCLHTVGQRQIGIVYNFSGTISGKKDPGVVPTWPWQHIKKENVGIQSEEFDLSPSNAAVSADQQPIYAKLFVNFQVEPANVIKLYKTVGPGWKKILLEARVLQDFKEVTAQYATPLITTHRPELRIRTRERLELELAKYDIRIVDVFVKNIGFSPDYSRAVEQKQVAVQAALQAVQEANQKTNLAKGEANAINLKGRALRRNPEVLQLEAINKLAPTVTTVICTGKTCPSFLPQSFAQPQK